MDFQLNLRTEPVTEGCLSEPVCCGLATPIRDVLSQLAEQSTGAALICDDDGLLKGIFTERDALQLFATDASLDGPISSVMTAEPATIAAMTPIGDAISRMYQGGYRRLPVIDEAGKPVGLVKTALLVRYLVDHFPDAVYNLPPDPHHATQEREGA